jgi:hypothetical protein
MSAPPSASADSLRDDEHLADLRPAKKPRVAEASAPSSAGDRLPHPAPIFLTSENHPASIYPLHIRAQDRHIFFQPARDLKGYSALAFAIPTKYLLDGISLHTARWQANLESQRCLAEFQRYMSLCNSSCGGTKEDLSLCTYTPVPGIAGNVTYHLFITYVSAVLLHKQLPDLANFTLKAVVPGLVDAAQCYRDLECYVTRNVWKISRGSSLPDGNMQLIPASEQIHAHPDPLHAYLLPRDAWQASNLFHRRLPSITRDIEAYMSPACAVLRTMANRDRDYQDPAIKALVAHDREEAKQAHMRRLAVSGAPHDSFPVMSLDDRNVPLVVIPPGKDFSVPSFDRSCLVPLSNGLRVVASSSRRHSNSASSYERCAETDLSKPAPTHAANQDVQILFSREVMVDRDLADAVYPDLVTLRNFEETNDAGMIDHFLMARGCVDLYPRTD